MFITTQFVSVRLTQIMIIQEEYQLQSFGFNSLMMNFSGVV